MSSSLRENWLEAMIGLAVVAVATWFVIHALGRAGAGGVGARYEVIAQFPNASGISAGTDVRVSGLKVGTVVASELDPKSYRARVRLALDRSLELPIDTSAAITQEGILGGSYIALTPGAEPETLKAGEEIAETQGAVDLMGLIGSVINRTGSSAAPPAAAPAP